MSDLAEIIRRITELVLELKFIEPLPEHVRQKIDDKLRMDWNFHSNRLEGNRLDYGETVALLLHDESAAGKPLLDHKHVVGHNQALKELEFLCKRDQSITETEIRHLHKTMLVEPYKNRAVTSNGIDTSKEVTPGAYKTQPNHVLTVTGELFRFAEPMETPSRMQELMHWYQEKHHEDYPLITASILHYDFLRIHPFDDGNGRMGRFLLNYHLMRSHLPPIIVPAGDKDAYLHALRQADAGQLNALTAYLGLRLIASLELTLRAARGEPIDESDDLDKQIAILKAEVAEGKRGGKIPISAEIIQKRVGKSILPLFQRIANQMAKFNDFFFKHQVEIVAFTPQGTANKSNVDTFESVPWLETIGERLSGAHLQLNYSFEGLRADPETPNYAGQARVIFFDFRYEVTWGNIKLTKFYNENVTMEEIEKAAKEEGTRLFEFIKAKAARS